MALGTNPAANSLMKIQFMKGTKMKKTRILKIAMTLAALALLACASVGIAVSAADGPEIVGINVAYNEDTHIAIGVDGITSENVGIAVWYDETKTEDFTLANSDYRNYEQKEDSKGNKYYKTHAIASDEYADGFIVSLVVDGALTGEKYTVSVVKYLNNRIFGDDAVSVAQDTLYSDMLIHGIAADLSIDNAASYAVVKTVNGVAGSRNAYAAPVLDGNAVTIRAEAKNAVGEYFLYWTAPDGSKIYDRVTAVAPTANGINTYTAVYGDAADSAYANTIDFEALDTGVLSFTAPTGKSFSGTYASAYAPYLKGYWNCGTITAGNVVFYNSILAQEVGIAYSEDKAVVDENGNIVTDHHEIIENAFGDKAVYVDKIEDVYSYGHQFIDPAVTDTAGNWVEFDFIPHGVNASSAIDFSLFYITGSSSSSDRITVSLVKSGGNIRFKIKSVDQYSSYFDYVLGSDKELAVKFEIVTTDSNNLGVNIYVDGNLITESPLDSTKSADGVSVDFHRLHYTFYAQEVGEYTIDNVTFTK